MKSSAVSKHLLFISACSVSSFVWANSINGVVKTENGELVQQGLVQVMGSNQRVPIGPNGEFSIKGLDLGEVELHVSAPSYVHDTRKLNLTASGLNNVTIEVSKASIEIFDVTASAFHASSIESAAPVNVLAGDELRAKQSSTLGETLKNEVGVHSNFYGGVTSSPIIRGLDGHRVLITQNGMDAGDASRVGPDHLVSTEASTATQIEVLRGPATLFYGSGAIGGVVNIVDDRIPTNADTEGEVSVSRNTNNSEESFAGDFKSGAGDFAFNVQGFYRDSDDYRIPGYAESEEAHDDHDEDHDDEHEEGSKGVVENTQSRTQGFTVGASYLLDNGFIGASVEHQSSLYGIPGHAHGHEDEHDDEHEDEDHMDEEHEEGEELVLGDMQQNRYQIASRLSLENSIFTEFNGNLSFTNYTHAEIEDGEEGTRFSNDSLEGRVELLHQPIMGWRGGLSFHYKDSDFEAIGEEAFTPPSNTTSFGVGLIEEQHFGDWLIQLGARIERVEIDVPALQFADIELHSEHEDEHEEGHEEHDEHDEGHSDLGELSGFSKASYTPVSLSVGAVWDFTPGYNLGLSYVAAERAPSTAELYSFGPHIGTQTYELGALFQVDEDGEVEVNPDGLGKEKSQNIDISLRKFKGDFGFVINAFFNRVDDYYYAADTGFVLGEEHGHEDDHDDEHGHDDDMHHDDEHGEEGHGEEGHDEHGHSDELPVFAYVSEDVEIYGLEAEFNWRLTQNINLKAQGDIVKTKIVSSGDSRLPRTPPARFGLAASYTESNWNASLQAMKYFDQSDVAEFESETDGYTLVDLDFNYYVPMGNSELTLFAKARNLTDQEARVHTSFLKNLAPLPGRSFVIGVRANF